MDAGAAGWGTTAGLTHGRDDEHLQQILEQSRAYAELIFTSVPEPLLLLSHDLYVKAANDKFYEHFRMRPEETVGRAAFDLNDGEWDLPPLRNLLEKVLRDEGAFSDYRVEHAFDRLGHRTLLLSGHRLGDLQLILLAIKDITEQVQAQEALRASEERYHAIFDTVGVSIWEEDFSQVKVALDALQEEGVTDVPGYLEENPGFVERMLDLVLIRDVNEATLKLYEAASKDELLGPLRRIFLPETMEVFKEELITLVEGEAFLASEVAVQTMGGRRIDVAFTFTAADAPTYSHVLVSLLDITQRKKKEDLLRESESQFRALTNAAPMLIRIAGVDMRYSFFNEGWLRFTGRSMDQEKGDGWCEGVHPDDFDRCLETIRNSSDKRAPFEMEYRLRRHDGEYRWVIDRGVPRFASDGSFLGYIGSCIDIHERKLAEKALRESKDILAERVEERSEQVRQLMRALVIAEQEERQRIARILHDDLQQYLYGLGMTLRLLRKHRSEEDAQHLRDQADEILNEATDLTRMLSSDLSPPVLYSGDTQDIMHWLAIRAQEQHDLKVDVDVREGIQLPNRNLRVLLYQALHEVLSNVVKHSGVRHARLSAWEENGELVVAVEDTGSGFEVAVLDKPVQLEGHFGLANVRERLVLVGGRFEIASETGKGTRVTLALPTQGVKSGSEEDA